MKINRVILLLAALAIFLPIARTQAMESSTDKFVRIEISKEKNAYQIRKLEVVDTVDYPKKYSPDSFEPYKGSYNGRVVSFKEAVLGYFPTLPLQVTICKDKHNPKTGKMEGGCEELDSGPISLDVPFFPNGKFADIYSPQGEKLLTIDLSSIATCNENGQCEKEKRESYGTCPSDCENEGLKQLKIVDTPPTANPADKTPLAKSNLYLWIIVALVVISAIAGLYLWKKRGDA